MANRLIRQPFGGGRENLLISSEAGELGTLDPTNLKQSLAETGFLLLRGFNVTDEAFQELAEDLGGVFVPHGAPQRQNIAGDPHLHAADPGMGEINLHIELGYLPNPPDIIWFHCVTPPSAGGSTTICDGAVIARHLSDKAIQLLKTWRLSYSACWAKHIWSRYMASDSPTEVASKLSALPGMQFKFHGEQLVLEYKTPALLATGPKGAPSFANSLISYILDGYETYLRLENGERIPSWLMEELKQLCQEHVIDVHWQTNDILILDNLRVMHGRRAHSDPNRKLHVRMQKLDRRPESTLLSPQV